MKDIIAQLQEALDATGFAGRVVRSFVEKHGHQYQVGLAELDDGRRVVVKTKRTGRDAYGKAYTREAEHQNLQLLQRLSDTRIPQPLYYAEGALFMSYIDGVTLRSVDAKELTDELFEELGRLYRKINDLIPDDPDLFLKFKDMGAVVEHEFELLFAERLATEHIDRSFYDRLRTLVVSHASMRQKVDLGLIAKDAAGHENILIKDGRLAGLIDFEDLLIAPRLLQLRIDIDDRHRMALRKGYGADAYDLNWEPSHIAALGLISNMRGLYKALHETPVATDWIERIRLSYDRNVEVLGIELEFPLRSF